MKLQCKVSNVLRRHDDELSVRFEIVSDLDVKKLDDQVQYWYREKGYLEWTPGMPRQTDWAVPLIISCWKTQEPITCKFEKSKIVGVDLLFVPTDNNT